MSDKWISCEDELPPENKLVLVEVEITQAHIPSSYYDHITGWRTTDYEGEKVWAYGNESIFWDYEYNIGNVEAIRWKPIDPPSE